MVWDTTPHSASETVRGYLLTVSECSKGIKSCRRLKHQISRGVGSNAVNQKILFEAKRTEVLLSIAQRLLASGFDVKYCPSVKPPLVIGDVSIDVTIGIEKTAIPEETKKKILIVSAGGDRRHLGCSTSRTLVASKALLYSAPRLLLSATRAWAGLSGAEMNWVDLITPGLFCCETVPSRIHGELLRLISSNDRYLLTMSNLAQSGLALLVLKAKFQNNGPYRSLSVQRILNELTSKGCFQRPSAEVLAQLSKFGYIAD